jgi:hypothetical protein
MLNLYDGLKASYKSNEEADQIMKKYGYELNSNLSDAESKVYYHPKTKDLLMSFRGTKNLLNDVPTDAALAFGQIRNTDRFKRTNDTYLKAKDYYDESTTHLIGHSLGAGLASAVGRPEDQIFTYNKGHGLFDPATKNKTNETHYRTPTDLVSLLSVFDNENNKYIGFFNPVNYLGPLAAHNLDRIENLFV